MWRNRLLYLLALAGATVFFLFYYAWFSEFLWWLVLVLPLFSLLVSLPAMLTVRPEAEAPAVISRGDTAWVTLSPKCVLPAPPCRFRIRAVGTLSGRVSTGRKRARQARLTCQLPTDHCGTVTLQPRRVWVSDYLGLISIPRFWKQETAVTVLPCPQPPRQMPATHRLLCPDSRPKPGGGFSESYELRDYRPGDSLRQIHWKLTAKSEGAVVREPQEPLRGPVVLSLDLRGSAQEIDSVMEKALFLSRWLIGLELPHRVCWISGDTPIQETVEELGDTDRLALSLARSLPSREGFSAESVSSTAWHYHVRSDS